MLIESEVIPKAHVSINVKGTESTCTEHGYTDMVVCEACGEVLEGGEELPLLDHTPAKDGENTKATIENPGFITGTRCTSCNTIIEEGHYYTLQALEIVGDSFTPTQCDTSLSLVSHANVLNFVSVYYDEVFNETTFKISDYYLGRRNNPTCEFGMQVTSEYTNKSSLSVGDYYKLKITLNDGSIIEETATSPTLSLEVDYEDIESIEFSTVTLYLKDEIDFYSDIKFKFNVAMPDFSDQPA